MNVQELIQNINQVMSKSHDGATHEDGSPVKIGLRREEGHILNDSRIIDGFKIRFQGCNMIVIYESPISIKEMHKPSFENELEAMFNNISNFIKKEYNKTTQKTLSLSPVGETKIDVRMLNRHQAWVECCKVYCIGQLKRAMNKQMNDSGSDSNLNESLKSFTERFRNGTLQKD